MERQTDNAATAQALRRAFYVSLSRVEPSEVEPLLERSRTNNRRDGITGVLLYSGGAFAQLLEGEPAAVGAVLARIAADPRHTAMRVLLDEPAGERMAVQWTMRLVQEESADDLLRLLVQTPEIDLERARQLLARMTGLGG
jgi:hypothetical protein